MTRKTLLLCFIHGFKGDDNTFGSFPEHLRALLAHELPHIDVKAIVYPTFETRGELADSVSRFRDWLQDRIIDLEVAAHTPSPTISPSIHPILLGHSMGGIVAADALLLIASDLAVPLSLSHSHASSPLFPAIAGLLAFDTPYLGIAPAVVAHGAETQYQAASALVSMFTKSAKPAETQPGWGWGRVAALAGAVAVAGGAAYVSRREIGEGVGWATSHLEFVGCLMRGEELRRRVVAVQALSTGGGGAVGWVNLYTRLGERAGREAREAGRGEGEGERTFCNLPKGGGGMYWREEVNDAARDEVAAHMNMFYPLHNPGYAAMSEHARDYILEWTRGLFVEKEGGMAA